MKKRFLLAVLALTASITFTSSQLFAAEKLDFILNWISGGDHAPYFYAYQRGWYADAGIDLEIQQGKGSSMSSQRVDDRNLVLTSQVAMNRIWRFGISIWGF